MFIIHISNLLRMNDIRVSKHISMQYPKANEINIENYEHLKRRGGVEILHRDRYSRVVLPILARATFRQILAINHKKETQNS